MESAINSLLYRNTCPVNAGLTIRIPTLGEIFSYGENEYMQLISMITATSKDYMVQLSDMGVDFEEISDFQLFSQLLFNPLKEMDTTILFGDLDLPGFELMLQPESKEFVLYHSEKQMVLDRYTHFRICEILREIHYFTKDEKKPGNSEAKAFMIECARRRQKRAAKKEQKPILSPLVIALVNCREFKYNYQEASELTIHQFYSSVGAIQKRINFDQIMAGIYAGTVSSKDINMQEINWLA